MKRPPLKTIVAVAVLASIGLATWLFWPRGGAAGLTGYVEGETLYFAAPASGAVTALNVERGQRVAAGTVLFAVDAGTAQAQGEQARAAAQAAGERAQDALKGQRPQELAVFQAQRASAKAQLDQAEAEFRRVQTLAAKGIYAPARLDQARASVGVARAQYQETLRRLDVAELGAREDQAQAAAAEAERARAGVTEADVRTRQLSPAAPVAGRVEDVFYRPGEWAVANTPVVALLPDDRVKLRFFVPQSEVTRYRPGGRVRFSCDGCRGGEARIAYVSPRPEFTPPVIYSRGNRERLVFLVEATPERPGELAPGQPVEIARLGDAE
ncbi:MAG TPA: HlyD family efflux transporter periplasmic adaptor subunit [Caulobacter sp.]|nr:HlyD family efflux transporter periplasmic adaptor subunit [Caulobacter sp.]